MEEEEIDHRVKQNRGVVCAWCARVRRTMAAGAGGALASAPAWTRRIAPRLPARRFAVARLCGVSESCSSGGAGREARQESMAAHATACT